MSVTLGTIAKNLGISVAATSMALNGKPGVSEETRIIVLAEAERLGYQPNHNGRSLRLSRSGLIGIYAPRSILDYSVYYDEVTRGVVAGFSNSEYTPVLLPSIADTGKISDFPKIDGCILVEPHTDDLGVSALISSRLPTVCIDPPAPEAGAPWAIVESDSAHSTLASLKHMTEQGAQHPALLTVETVSQWTQSLLRQYQQWCADSGKTATVLHVSPGDSNEDLAQRIQSAVTHHSVDGLLICGAGVAVRIAGVLRTLGLGVGTDVKLVSAVDSAMMKYHTPSITAVDLTPESSGHTAAATMLTLLETAKKPAHPVHVTMPTTLYVRDT